MTAGTNEDGPDGTAGGHAYTVIGVMTLSNGVKLVKVRNPWGSEYYEGPWGDDSDLWTDALREEVNAELGDAPVENNWQQNNNGIFFADIDTFRRNFSETQINFDTTDWKFASWLMTNDTSNAT